MECGGMCNKTHVCQESRTINKLLNHISFTFTPKAPFFAEGTHADVLSLCFPIQESFVPNSNCNFCR